MSKHILFYSNFCNFCQDLLTEIIKKGVRKQFVLISVEKHKSKLPQFVKSVPFIVDSKGQNVPEHRFSHFLDEISEKDEYDDITAFVSCPRGHFGNEFCFVDDTPKKNDVASTLGYVFIDENDKYQGCEEDTTLGRKQMTLNNPDLNPKQMLQRDVYEQPPLSSRGKGGNGGGVGDYGNESGAMNQRNIGLMKYSPNVFDLEPPMQGAGHRANNIDTSFGGFSQGNSIGSQNILQSSSPSTLPLPLSLQAQDPRLATLPSGNTMAYNPNIGFQNPEPQLPFEQIKVEKQKKIGDHLVDDLMKQRMNDFQGY